MRFNITGTPATNVSLVSLNFRDSFETSSRQILDNNFLEFGPEIAIPWKSSDLFL